jgi:hypothetical protein
MMRMRWPAALAAALAAALLLTGAHAQRQPGEGTPAALRQFDGTLYGEVLSTSDTARFSGLVLRIALVESAPGSEPVDLAKVANSRVSIRVPAGKNGRPVSPELASALRVLRPGQAVRVDARATGPEHALYASHLQLTGSVPLPAHVPTRATVGGTNDGPDVERMNQELQSLRRDLAHLQQDVAELRALTRELAERLPQK